MSIDKLGAIAAPPTMTQYGRERSRTDHAGFKDLEKESDACSEALYVSYLLKVFTTC
jgi:hypothetical protein